MSFFVKKGDQYLKRSYNTWDGTWTQDQHRAVRWKTRKGAESSAVRIAGFLARTQQEASAKLVHVKEENDQ